MRNQLRRTITAVFAFCICLFSLSASVFAEQEGPDVRAESYCVMDAETGEIILWKNKDEKLNPASITKVLTALVVIENCPNLDEVLTYSAEAISTLTANSSTLEPMACIGEKMTVRDALYGLILCSGNECANALAEHVAGTRAAFAEMMNDKANELGAKNSHFANAHGLTDPNHYTTAYDMAVIFRAALQNSTFLQIDSTVQYTIPATNMSAARSCGMGHQMISGQYPCEGVYAGKTGRTNEAGRTLLTAAKRNGKNLITVIMKSADDTFYGDTAILLEYGFGIACGEIESLNWDGIEETVWASGSVTIRQYPSIHSTPLGTLTAGQTITRLGDCQGWSKVMSADGVAYIASQYLVNYDPANPPPETSEPSTEAPVQTTSDETNSQDSESNPADSSSELSPTGASNDSQNATTQGVKPTDGGTPSEGNGGNTVLIVVLSAAIAAVLGIIFLLIRNARREKIRRQRLAERRRRQRMRDELY